MGWEMVNISQHSCLHRRQPDRQCTPVHAYHVLNSYGALEDVDFESMFQDYQDLIGSLDARANTHAKQVA